MNYVVFQIENKNHSKNARHVAALYFLDITTFISFILIILNWMMLSGRKSVTNSLSALPSRSRFGRTRPEDRRHFIKQKIPQIIDLAGLIILNY
ncbi:MAG: hypothetical protein NTY95_07795, partial [Bacteroidia bacterium]|nr:hypothetical protein [Bacteroidia bacterium]